MRRMFATLAVAAGLLVVTADLACAQYQPYAGRRYGYNVTYQQAYGESGYTVVHPGYSDLGYNVWPWGAAGYSAETDLRPALWYGPYRPYRRYRHHR